MRFFLMILSISLCASDYNILFIHLGKNVPTCLFTTMKQARYLNQDCDLYLLMDSAAIEAVTFPEEGFLLKYRISLVNVKDILSTSEHDTFRHVNKIDYGLTGGLWGYSLERFFYLFDFIKEKELYNVFHFESDTMLYIDLEELILVFKQHDLKLAAPFQSTVGCIPCMVFVQDSGALSPLMQHIIYQTETYTGNCPHIDIGDMQMLAKFFARFGDVYMTPLPTLMAEYGKHFSKRKSSFALDNDTSLEFLSKNEGMFPGYIFDAAALGVFANGNDRRYLPDSKPGVIHYRSIFDPGNFRFFWGEDQKGRVVPYFTFEEKTYRVVNLHFHSKEPERYTSYGQDQVSFPRRSH